MINHIRTLFMHIHGDTGIFPEIPGDELIDPSFKAKALPSYLANIRTVLCGVNPDRATLNYRARQLLMLIHDSRYSDYALQFDPRITYLDIDDLSFYGQTSFTSLPSICDLFVNLQSLGGITMLILFGAENAEPWDTFRNLWQSAPETGNKMVGLLLAYLYRLEETRVADGV